ncbi:MAG: hypothetical protein LM517_11100 [Nitrosomonas sp.]|nr:hypothetical protein [Nitrosomonas sp.]
MLQSKYRSIFTSASKTERNANFENYWIFTQNHGGELLEEEKDLAKKRAKLKYFQDNPIRLRKPLEDSEAFYRNYVEMQDDPKTLDPLVLVLSAIYKFARHEWVGIKGAWEVIPNMESSYTIEDKISRVHLAEEFCHVRLFDEMLRTCGLDEVKWVPLSPMKEKIYEQFPKLPSYLLDTPAFVTELMGVTFYCHLDDLIGKLFIDEPEVSARLKEILNEITIDEVAHVGQRRNFIGPIGIRVSKFLVKPFYTMFFRDIPEMAILFDVKQMVEDGERFDYTQLPEAIVSKSWVPSYCKF